MVVSQVTPVQLTHRSSARTYLICLFSCFGNLVQLSLLHPWLPPSLRAFIRLTHMTMKKDLVLEAGMNVGETQATAPICRLLRRIGYMVLSLLRDYWFILGIGIAIGLAAALPDLGR